MKSSLGMLDVSIAVANTWCPFSARVRAIVIPVLLAEYPVVYTDLCDIKMVWFGWNNGI